jgi:MoaA/NifB/PqqE/SkfB family radical SAM enzyme
MRSHNSQPLRELRIELLEKCTLACVHCSAESSPATSRSLSPELVVRLLREGEPLGLKSVVFTLFRLTVRIVSPSSHISLQNCSVPALRTCTS